MVSSLLIVLGVIALIFFLDALYGAIVLAIFSLFMIVLVIVLLLTYKGIMLRGEKRADIIKESKYTFE
jgi:predicted ABC-type exoprotein transport system permease subunit